MTSRSPPFTSSITNRLSGPVGVIAAARAELITSATEMNLPHQCRSLEGVSVSGGLRR